MGPGLTRSEGDPNISRFCVLVLICIQNIQTLSTRPDGFVAHLVSALSRSGILGVFSGAHLEVLPPHLLHRTEKLDSITAAGSRDDIRKQVAAYIPVAGEEGLLKPQRFFFWEASEPGDIIVSFSLLEAPKGTLPWSAGLAQADHHQFFSAAKRWDVK